MLPALSGRGLAEDCNPPPPKFQCLFALCFFPQLVVGQNQWYHFWVGAPPILVYLSGDRDVHWRLTASKEVRFVRLRSLFDRQGLWRTPGSGGWDPACASEASPTTKSRIQTAGWGALIGDLDSLPTSWFWGSKSRLGLGKQGLPLNSTSASHQKHHRQATWDCDVVLDGIPEVRSRVSFFGCGFRRLRKDRLIWNVAKKHGP